VVNIDSKHCTCRKWSLTGIPCCHAVAAIKFLNLSEEDFLPHWFRISTYEETYNSIIYPCNGQQMWTETEFPDVLPPPKRILPGRPKKKRRLEAWEMNKNGKQITKHGMTKKCSICKEVGHNRKSCPQQPEPAPPSQPTPPTEPTPSTQPTPSTETASPTATVARSQPTPPTEPTPPTQPPPPTPMTQPTQASQQPPPTPMSQPTQSSQQPP